MSYIIFKKNFFQKLYITQNFLRALKNHNSTVAFSPEFERKILVIVVEKSCL